MFIAKEDPRDKILSIKDPYIRGKEFQFYIDIRKIATRLRKYREAVKETKNQKHVRFYNGHFFYFRKGPVSHIKKKRKKSSLFFAKRPYDKLNTDLLLNELHEDHEDLEWVGIFKNPNRNFKKTAQVNFYDKENFDSHKISLNTPCYKRKKYLNWKDSSKSPKQYMKFKKHSKAYIVKPKIDEYLTIEEEYLAGIDEFGGLDNGCDYDEFEYIQSYMKLDENNELFFP